MQPQLFAICPGLTYGLIYKHLPFSTMAHKGHMIHHHQDLDSTGSNMRCVKYARQYVADMPSPTHIYSANEGGTYYFPTIWDKTRDTIYSNLTGPFWLRLFHGMISIGVAYTWNFNAILLSSIKPGEDWNIIETFASIHLAEGYRTPVHTSCPR